MSKRQRHHKEFDDKKRIARITKEVLVLVITVLLVIILDLLFRVGDVLWPAGLVEYRNQIAGVLSFIIIILILLSPIIIDFNSNPRALSGPGKDPRHGP